MFPNKIQTACCNSCRFKWKTRVPSADLLRKSHSMVRLHNGVTIWAALELTKWRRGKEAFDFFNMKTRDELNQQAIIQPSARPPVTNLCNIVNHHNMLNHIALDKFISKHIYTHKSIKSYKTDQIFVPSSGFHPEETNMASLCWFQLLLTRIAQETPLFNHLHSYFQPWKYRNSSATSHDKNDKNQIR